MDNSHGEDDDHRGLNDPDERHEGMGLMPPGTGDFAPLPPPPGMMPPPLMPPGMQGMPPPPPGMGHPPGMPPPPGMGMPPPHHMPGPPPGMPHPPGQGPPRPGLLPTPQGMHGMPPPPGQGPPPSMTLPPPPPGQGPPPGMPPPGQGMMPPPSGQGPPHGMPPPHPSMSIPPPGQGPPPGMPPPPPGQGPPPGMPPPPPGQGPPPGMPPPPPGQGPPPGMPPPPLGQGPPPGMPPPPGQGPPPGMPPPGQGPPPGMPHPPGQGPPPGMPPPPPGQGPPPGMPPPPPGQGPPPGMPPPGQGPPPNMPSGLPPNIPPPNQPMHPPGPPPGMPPQMGQGPPPGMPPPLGQPLPPSQQDMSKMPPRSEPLSDISLRPPGSDPEDRPNREEKEDRPESREREREPREKPNRLPQALEKALAFKSRRAFELGFDESDLDGTTVVEEDDSSKGLQVQSALEDLEEYEDDDDKDEPQEKKRNKRTKSRKKKKRKSRAQRQLEASSNTSSDKENKSKSDKASDKPLKVEIEYVQEKLSMFELEPQYRSYAKIFEVFRMTENVPAVKLEDSLLADIAGLAKKAELSKVPKLPEEDDMDENDKAESKAKLSKRKMKKMTRLSIAELKQLVSRPDVVEMHDVTARDPKLLVQLKAHRNTVPVPRHWCFKRKYLQGKRGIEKPPFDLPDFIKKTGIMEMRSALQDKEETKTLKAKMRERARPKMGKIDIDYQKLHDAFFKWQTKPRLTIHGDLYYEGKEYETRLKEKKPGELSSELRVALGMPVGAGAHKVPPPWLIAMQRYGPPPSYPNLRIPGLNCPIPEGASFGYHAGGWGKPPVDETGKPLYGDVFATAIPHSELAGEEEEVEKNTWGELESESEEESSDSEGEGEGEDESGLTTPGPEGLATPSGIATVPSGIETPDIIELRKKKIEADMDGGDTPALYQVVPEKRVERVGNAMMGSTHVYDLGASSGTASVGGTTSVTSRKDTVEVALDPSELDMDTDAMAARYEQQIKEQQSHLQKEDLSDMLADHVNRQKNKRKKQQQTQENKPSKKYKEFKF